MKKLIVSTCIAAGLLLPAPAALADEAAPPVGVQQCPTGDVGIIVWYVDPKTGTRQELIRACVLIAP